MAAQKQTETRERLKWEKTLEEKLEAQKKAFMEDLALVINDFEAEIKDLKREKDLVQRQLRDETKRLESHKRLAEERHQAAVQLQQQVDRLQHEIEEEKLKRECAMEKSISDSHQTLIQEIGSKNQEIRDLKASVAQFTNQVESLESELERVQSNLAATEENLTAALAIQARQKNDLKLLDELNSELETMTMSKEELYTRYVHVCNKIMDQETSLIALGQESLDRQTQCTELEGKIKDLEDTILSLSNKANRYSSSASPSWQRTRQKSISSNQISSPSFSVTTPGGRSRSMSFMGNSGKSLLYPDGNSKSRSEDPKEMAKQFMEKLSGTSNSRPGTSSTSSTGRKGSITPSPQMRRPSSSIDIARSSTGNTSLGSITRSKSHTSEMSSPSDIQPLGQVRASLSSNSLHAIQEGTFMDEINRFLNSPTLSSSSSDLEVLISDTAPQSVPNPLAVTSAERGVYQGQGYVGVDEAIGTDITTRPISVQTDYIEFLEDFNQDTATAAVKDSRPGSSASPSKSNSRSSLRPSSSDGVPGTGVPFTSRDQINGGESKDSAGALGAMVTPRDTDKTVWAQERLYLYNRIQALEGELSAARGQIEYSARNRSMRKTSPPPAAAKKEKSIVDLKKLIDELQSDKSLDEEEKIEKWKALANVLPNDSLESVATQLAKQKIKEPEDLSQLSVFDRVQARGRMRTERMQAKLRAIQIAREMNLEKLINVQTAQGPDFTGTRASEPKPRNVRILDMSAASRVLMSTRDASPRAKTARDHQQQLVSPRVLLPSSSDPGLLDSHRSLVSNNSMQSSMNITPMKTDDHEIQSAISVRMLSAASPHPSFVSRDTGDVYRVTPTKLLSSRMTPTKPTTEPPSVLPHGGSARKLVLHSDQMPDSPSRDSADRKLQIPPTKVIDGFSRQDSQKPPSILAAQRSSARMFYVASPIVSSDIQRQISQSFLNAGEPANSQRDANRDHKDLSLLKIDTKT
eukprot:TRINITY_DN8665_c0_g1_i4.p1 TRINITY_DN8665_c0_g1~~TRINITY_DN8665_c0_g1_i4.p1  ORF type:complete len:976 (-),score=199.65 TRINITY_DN8665_c0_g1_i4:293-3220(-)